MKKENHPSGTVEDWIEDIKTIPSLTEADSQDLRYQLEDTIEELKFTGLKEEDAFDIARLRMGGEGLIRNEYHKVNESLLQVQKVMLASAGVMVYFLLFYTLQVTLKLLAVNLEFKKNTATIYSYAVLFHLLVVSVTIFLLYAGRGRLKKIDWLRIKPSHVFWLFLGLTALSAVNVWMSHLVNDIFMLPLDSICGIMGYTFPLVFITCFLLLYNKYYVLLNLKYNSITDEEFLLKKNNHSGTSLIPINPEQITHYWDEEMERLHDKGFEKEEAFVVGMKRQGYHLSSKNGKSWDRGDYTLQAFLKILSGILFYFLLFFLLKASSRIFFSVLQHTNPDTLVNVKHTWTFVITAILLFLFFTSSVYLMHENLLQRIKKFKVSNTIMTGCFLLTIVLAAAERYFTMFSRRMAGKKDLIIFHKMEDIFFFINWIFPLLISACFLLLFWKYYKQNIKQG